MSTIENESPPDGPNFKTSLFEKFSYGMGDVACNVVFALTSGLVVYFYTNVIGVSAALVGTILLISRIFDGISDLVIAQLIDKVNSKRGKARAWLFWMALPYAISAILLFAVPANADTWVQAIYIFVTYNLCTTVVYTALNLPYATLAPLMTRNNDDLAKLNLFRMSMSPIGNMIVTALTLPFIRMMGGDQRAWIIVTAIYGVIAIGMLIWTYYGTKERFHDTATQEAEALPFKDRFAALARNKYFWILTLAMMIAAFYQNINGITSTYYAQYILGDPEIMGILQTVEKVPWIVCIIFMAPFIRRFGKRNLVVVGAVLCVIAQVILSFNTESLPLAIFAAFLRGVGEAPLYGVVFTMLADVISFGHWLTGVRVHALVFSAVTVGQKFGGGIAGWAIGALLESSGFEGREVEIASAVSMVEWLYVWGSAIVWAALFVLMLFYRLDKELPSIEAELSKAGSQGEGAPAVVADGVSITEDAALTASSHPFLTPPDTPETFSDRDNKEKK